MASRRDELNAYTFAKKRLVSAFLQPSSTGTEEGAPRPLRAVLPGIVIGALVLVGFGAWGMFKPKAPKDWNKPGEKVIVGSESTTRYVVLKTKGTTQLHPVLNLASARLLLDPQKGDVVKVDEKVLDGGEVRRGASIGIPYAPDRLPTADEASTSVRWAVCVRPSPGGGTAQRAAFVFAERERERVDGRNRLRGGELLYVAGQDGTRYVVDKKGTKYRIRNDRYLLRAIVGDQRPQRVTDGWLDTLREGDPIRVPRLPADIGSPAEVPGTLRGKLNTVGTVLKTTEANVVKHYLVLKGRVVPVSAFVATLLLGQPELAHQGGKAKEFGLGGFEARGPAFAGHHDWPKAKSERVNTPGATGGARDTLCGVLRGVDRETGRPTLSTWAGKSYPAPLPTGSTSAYVTPGAGQLFRQVTGRNTRVGPVFLVTDTGLRYALQSNSDSARDESDIGSDGKSASREKQTEESQGAQRRLGYENVKPTPVPAAWSRFLPTGPRLSPADARQPQGS
ncbi:type VII secretion protein EccB [Streptomyces sp. AJS327]|uniref:type VII secretion protein EccB n=1 Tax=Streptomyces sp. AJS327 TaxID=2545265 RepID=UPI0015DD9D0B|nr:type VII secretion protein EccB [Streptomyces sp. AJS327]MBA0051879.1 type VII secretion protein EccB [Streptomyces sp. AJS327]